MKITTYKEVKSKEIDKELYLCDMCKEEYKPFNGNTEYNNKISFTKGLHYQGGGYTEGVEAHLCPNCKKEIYKLLKEKINFQKVDIGY